MIKNKFFPEINGNFGFGAMRLPMKGGDVDYEEFSKMTDAFLKSGLNYFDTAHGYINGKSETALRDCLCKRYPRDKFILTDKLSDSFFNKQEDIRLFFEKQLAACGVDYFDFYLMHAQDKNNYKKYQRCEAYETAYKFKEEGLVRHFGISFHDKAAVLEKILNDHPEIEIVQIQLNYVDYEDSSVESRKVYEVCEKYSKPAIVMEPVKGGNLVNLPPEADKILRDLGGGSNASYALRFAGSFPNIAMVISGMSDMNQMRDNLSFMVDFKELEEKELAAVNKVRDIFNSKNLIPCTGCRYCIEENHCPKNILIPDIFAARNSYETFKSWNSKYYYNSSLTGGGNGRASDCVKCGKCEMVCPQHLEIRKLLTEVSKVFE